MVARYSWRPAAGAVNQPGWAYGSMSSWTPWKRSAGRDLGSSGKHPTVICRNRFVANNEFADGGFGSFSERGARDVLISANKFKLHNGSAVFFADRGAPSRTSSSSTTRASTTRTSRRSSTARGSA